MADTTVTGRIGDMDVALINAASEATLMKLLEQMSALNTKMSGSGGTGQGGQQGQATAVTNTTTAFNKAGQAVGAFAGAIADATKGLLNFAGNLIGGTFLALKNLTTELFLGGNRVTDFTKHLANLPSIFGTLGSAVHLVTSFFQSGVDTFRSLSQVGAGFTGSLTDMRIMAAESGMTLERFSKTVIDNAEKMALFGNSVSSGAQRFGKLSKDLRESEAGTRLMNMGFSIDEINETLITYAGINARMGRDRARGDTEMISRAAEFGEALAQAAAATGLSRKEIGNVADTLSKDITIGALSRRFAPGKERDDFMAGIAAFVGKFKEGGGMFLEAASGFIRSPQMLSLRTMSSEFVSIPQRFAKGQISYIDAQNAMTEEARKQLERLETDPMYLEAMKARPGFEAAYRALKEYAGTAKISAEEVAAQAKRQAESKQVDELFKTFDNLIETFRATFALKFLQSDAFKEFENVINGVLTSGGGFPNVLDTLLTAFETLLRGVSQFISDWQAFGFKKAFSNAMSSIQEGITEWWSNNTGEGSFFADIKNDISEAISTGIQDGAKGLWTSIKEFAFTYWKEIAIGFGTIAALWLGKQVIGGAASGIGQRLAGAGGPANAPGAGGEFSALKALGGSFAQAAGWLMKGVAIGGSMVAIGYGLGKLAEGIAPFKDIDVESLGKAGATLTVLTGSIMILGKVLTGPQLAGFAIGTGAIAALGLALNAFPTDVLDSLSKMMATVFAGVATNVEKVFNGISNIIGKITEMRTAMAKAATDQIKELASIPSDNMLAAAAGINAIKKALDGFSPGMFKGFSEMLGGMFASDKVGPLEKMAELGPRLGAAAPGFTAFKEAMGGGFNVVGLTLNPQQAQSISILSKGMPAYAAGLETVSKLGPNLQGTATALQAFVEASQGVDLNKFIFSKEQSANLVDGTNKLKNLAAQLSNASKEFKKLDESGLKKIKEGVEGLSKAFKDFNESFIEKFLPKFESMKSTTQEGLLTEVGSKLDTLNSNMSALVGIERDSRGYLNTISTQRPGKIS
jgi:hypothetical protein